MNKDISQMTSEAKIAGAGFFDKSFLADRCINLTGDMPSLIFQPKS